MSDCKCIILLTDSEHDRKKIINLYGIENNPLHICISKNGISTKLPELPASLTSNTIIILQKHRENENNARNINAILKRCSEFILAIHDMAEGYENRKQKLHSELSKSPTATVNYTTASGDGVKKWIDSFIKESKESQLQKKFNNLFNELWDIFFTSSKESTINHLLHLFLPLDIDMQALKILLEEKNDSRKAVDYFKKMLLESKDYHKKILNDAEGLLNQISDEKKKTEVKASFDKIRDFLGTLAELQPNKIPDFNNDKNKELKNDIAKFHNWYCALAECLRREKACKD